MKDYIKEICQICFDQLLSGFNNFFLHCTFDQGVVGTSLYYKTKGLTPKLIYIVQPHELDMLLYEFWENGFEIGKKDKWEIACLIFNNGKFSMDCIYPNEITDDQRNDYKFREQIIEKYFGKIKVEYPKYG